jgi:ribonuclease HI
MDKRATVFTDNQITLDRLQNNNIHSHLVEETTRKLTEMKTRGWKITLGWVKAHACNWGNELADKLAKKAAFNKIIPESNSKIPKSVTIKEIEEESLRKWQRIWTQTTKGKTTKEYFPEVA